MSETLNIPIPGQGLIVIPAEGTHWVALRQVADTLNASSDHIRTTILERHPGKVRKMTARNAWSVGEAWFAEVEALRCWLNGHSTRTRDRASRILEALQSIETPQAAETTTPAPVSPPSLDRATLEALISAFEAVVRHLIPEPTKEALS